MKLYPVIVHKDRNSAFGITVPDLPGCFSAGATLDEALRNVQEAVEVHLHGDDIAPEPSDVDRWKSKSDFRDAYAIGLAPVDLSFMNDVTVRVNITARKSELAIVDRAAKRAHMDRSAYLVASAIQRAKEGARAASTTQRVSVKRKMAGMVKAPARGVARHLESFDPASLLTRSSRRKP